MALILSLECRAEKTQKLMKQIKTKRERTFPPSEVTQQGKFLITFPIALFTPFLCSCNKRLNSVLGFMQNEFIGFDSLSSKRVKVGTIINDATKASVKPATVTRKKLNITSKEDLIVIPRRMVAQNAEKSWTVPTLAMQLVTLCSSDGTMFCRLHSPKKRATSDVDFPNRRNGMKMVVGSKETPAMETMPAVHI